MPRHILIKLTKTKHKERILKAAREKQQVTYNGNPICLTTDHSAESLQARREWQDIFKVLKGKNLQWRLLYPERISFQIDGEIKSFSDKQKLREFSTTKPALQRMLKRLLSLCSAFLISCSSLYFKVYFFLLWGLLLQLSFHSYLHGI